MSGNQVGRRTPDAGKSKNNMSTPQWGGHNYEVYWVKLYMHYIIFCVWNHIVVMGGGSKIFQL